jgi:hypothetical protein
LLEFEEDSHDQLKSRGRMQSRQGLRRMMTEMVESSKVRCIPKCDLRNLKVAVIGTKLL